MSQSDFNSNNNNNNNNIYLLQLGCHPVAVVSHPVAVVNFAVYLVSGIIWAMSSGISEVPFTKHEHMPSSSACDFPQLFHANVVK